MSNIKWYVGQPIVCIQTHSQGVVKKGEEYTIKSIKQCECGGIALDVGIISRYEYCRCECGYREITPLWWLSEEIFAPLDVDISELTEIITKEFQNK